MERKCQTCKHWNILKPGPMKLSTHDGDKDMPSYQCVANVALRENFYTCASWGCGCVDYEQMPVIKQTAHSTPYVSKIDFSEAW